MKSFEKIKISAKLFETGYFRPLDRYFAEFICKLEGEDHAGLYLAALILSRLSGQGNVCADLERCINGSDYPEEITEEEKIIFPDLQSWCELLAGMKTVSNGEGEFTPLVLRGQLLYLQRYWNYENKLARNLLLRTAVKKKKVNEEALQNGLKILFPTEKNNSDPDWQKIAAWKSISHSLSIIIGGPGTGKTTTIVKILLLLLEQAALNKKMCRIALCAPTGKAAAHLQRSIHFVLSEMQNSDIAKNNYYLQYLNQIPVKSYTIHRLLKNIFGTPYFKYNCQNQLPYDVLLVDETSMLDLALMSKFMEAVPAQSDVILLGDKDQLSSVEAGSVLGDLCYGEKQSKLYNSIMQLKKSYRFGKESGIGHLSGLVNKGDGQAAYKMLVNENKKYKDIFMLDFFIDESKINIKYLKLILSDYILKESNYTEYLLQKDILKMFAVFKKSQILCAVRRGTLGVVNINFLIEEILAEEGLIIKKGDIYHGLPLLVTRNDYALKIYNGDIGIVIKEGKNFYVYFEKGNVENKHNNKNSKFKKINPLQIKYWEPVYALTVHKSQGSEFENVFLILPDYLSPVLSRELIYTGVTRAKRQIKIMTNKDIFINACNKQINRMSGISAQLLEENY